MPSWRDDGASRQSLVPIIVGTSLVNGLEVYNVTVFGLYATIIGKQFFPADNPLNSLLLAVATFAFGFLMRPVGALLIGAYADRVGRRAALTLTIWLTAVGTATIACCPGAATIGMAAPIILIFGRLLEGVAAGGELGAAATYAVEAGMRTHRGWICGWQLASQAAAALIGASLGVFLSSAYSPIAPEPWGWRIAFFLGLLIVPAGIAVRRMLPEHAMQKANTVPGKTVDSGAGAAAGVAANAAPKAAEKAAPAATPNVALNAVADAACAMAPVAVSALNPTKVLFTEHARTVALVASLMAGRSVLFYAIVYYMPSYLSGIVHMPPMTGYIASTFAAALLVVLSPLTGWLADRVHDLKRLNVVATGVVTLLVFPVFTLAANHAAFFILLAAIGVICAALALGAPASNVLMLSVFPKHVRASGFAFSYGIGVTLFGGTAQFVVTALIRHTGNPISPAWYLTAACCLSFIAACCLKPVHQNDEPSAG